MKYFSLFPEAVSITFESFGGEMKKIFVLLLLSVFCLNIGFTSSTSARQNSDLPADLDSYLKKYPYPTDFMKNTPNVKKRLMSLLGNKFTLFNTNLHMQTPIEKQGNLLIGWGGLKTKTGKEEAMYIIDANTKKIHVGLVSEQFSTEYQIFSEDKGNVPKQLQDWIDARMSRR